MIIKKTVFSLLTLFIVFNLNAQMQKAWEFDPDTYDDEDYQFIGLSQMDDQPGLEMVFTNIGAYDYGVDVPVYIIDALTGEEKYTIERESTYEVSVQLVDVNQDGIYEILLSENSGRTRSFELYSFGSLSTNAMTMVAEVNAMSLKAYPAPATDDFTVEYILERQANVQLKFYNESGSLLKIVNRGTESAGKQQVSMKLSSFAPNAPSNGIYFCQLVAGNQSATCKLMKK